MQALESAAGQREKEAAGAPAMEAGDAGAVPTVTFTNGEGSWSFPAHRMEEAELSPAGLLIVFPGVAVLVCGPAKTLCAGFGALRLGRLRQVREREGVTFHLTRTPSAPA